MLLGYERSVQLVRNKGPFQTPPDQTSECNISKSPFQTPPFQTSECNISKSLLHWVSVPCPFYTCSIRVTDQTKYLAYTHPVSLAGTSKSQSSFQTLRIKCAIHTLRIKQHGNMHTGHVVLIRSQYVIADVDAVLSYGICSSLLQLACGLLPSLWQKL